MKSTAKAILFGGFILAAQAAMADVSGFPAATDDAGVTLAPRVTYADSHGNDRLDRAALAFPDSAPDGVFLPANVTYASEHAGDRITVVRSAFPEAVDDDGVHLIARSTYADTHLDRSFATRPGEGGDTAN